MLHVQDLPAGVSREREQSLAAAIQRHGPDEKAALDELIIANMRWAIKITLSFVNKYHIPSSKVDDLEGEALLATTKAAQKFAPNKQRFTTYLTTCIMRALFEAMNTKMFKVPEYMRTSVYVYNKVRMEKGLETFEDMEKQGHLKEVYDRAKEKIGNLSGKNFNVLLKRAIFLESARLQKLPHEYENDE